MDYNQNYEYGNDYYDRNQYINIDSKNNEIPNSIHKLIKLPRPVPIPPEKKLFNDFCKLDSKQHGQLEKQLESVYNSLRKSFKYYENPSQYVFTFPDSRFPPVPPGSQNNISYEHNIRFQQENTFRQSLSSEQIQQISQKGEFQVMSANPLITLPYVWKINTCLFRGRNARYEIWINGLAYIYELIIMAKNFLIRDIPEQLWSLTSIPKRFFSIFFGFKSHTTVYQENPQQQIMKDFLQEAFDTLYSKNDEGWAKQFWDLLNLPYDSRIQQVSKGTTQQRQRIDKLKQQLNKKHNQQKNKQQAIFTIFQNIDSKFDTIWTKQRKKIIQDIQQQTIQKMMNRPMSQNEQAKMVIEQNKQQIEEKVISSLQQRKFNMYLHIVRQQLPKNQTTQWVIQAILFVLQLFRILNDKSQCFYQRKAKAKIRIEKQVKKDHQIRSLSYLFFGQEVARRQEKIYAEIDSDFYNNLALDPNVKTIMTPLQAKIYQIYLNFRNTYQSRLQRKKLRANKIVIASEVYTQWYYLLPPYEVQRKQDSYGNVNYNLIKHKSMTIDTRNSCWKFWLYGMRLLCWTKNCFVCAIYLAINGPLGLLCLLPIKQFQYDEEINFATGQKLPQMRPTVIGVFIEVVNGAYQSRQAFEAQPDLGFFGKKFSRLCNLIECYIFRIFFVGVIIVLIFYPVVIILNFILMLFLIITVWLWVPLFVVLTYLFNINVYHFDDPNQNQQWSIRCLPIISTIVKVILVLLYVIYYIIRILITPIFCILVLLFYVARRVTRGITDRIMMIFIWCLGRVPSQDSAIAWKISGPGMSKNYYMSIGVQDALLLTQAEMQKILMQKLKYGLQKQINQVYDTYKKVMKKVLQPYVSSYNLRDNVILTCKNNLQTALQTQYNNYMNRYPRNPYNVRFTQQQMDNYLNNSIKIVTNFVQKHGISDWIFQDFHIADNDFTQLTHKVWVTIFNCGEQIFQPLQVLDKRFKLEDVAQQSSLMKKQKHSIMLAMEGQVDLNPKKVKIQPFKLGLSNANPDIVTLSRLANNYQKNNYNSSYISFDTISDAFIPQLSIKEIRKGDIINYEKQRQAYPQALDA